ncbi:MAG: sensor histidine kinase [Burkholderiales bacterium]
MNFRKVDDVHEALYAPPSLMRLPYPRSFLGLLIAGVVLVAAPLLIGLATSAHYTDRLAVTGQSALNRAVQTTQASRRIAALLRDLERAARQSVILGEGSLPEHYPRLRRQLSATAERLLDLPFDPEQRAKLDRVLDIEQAIYLSLSQPGKPDGSGAELGPVVARFAQANRLAEDIIERSDALIERESANMTAIAQRAQRAMFWLSAVAIPLAIARIWGFSIMLARPVRELDQAIGAIGSGKLSAPVEVNGPRALEELGRRLEWLRLELLDLEQQKNRFLRQVAHALKTPLAAVRESTDLLAERSGRDRTETERELMAILRRNGLELQRRIEDLLQLGEADFRRLTLNIDRIELDALFSEVRQSHQLAARAKRLRIEMDVAPDADYLSADPDKLRVIVDNLLSNAIKHAPAATAIELFARREHEAITIGIRDQGHGIPPQDRERVFDPYYQGEAAASGAIKGSGVGLSIVREYALAHGGKAMVTDDERGGAQVCVILPLLPRAVNE